MAYPAELLDVVESCYRQHFETDPVRASVSFLGVEPIEVLRFGHESGGRQGTAVHYLSLGMCRYPMTDPTEAVVAERTAPRAELILSLGQELDEIWRSLAVLAAAPAVEGAVYQVGGRVQLPDAIAAGSRCIGAVIAAGPLAAISVDGIADVQVLRIIPATATELAWARVHGSAALQQRWTAVGTDLGDLWRDPVDLTI